MVTPLCVTVHNVIHSWKNDLQSEGRNVNFIVKILLCGFSISGECMFAVMHVHVLADMYSVWAILKLEYA